MARAAVRILGVDAALRKTGLAVVEQEGMALRVMDSAVIRCPAAWPVSRCLRTLQESVETRIAAFQPGALALEGVFFCRNARTALRLGEARGAVIGSAARAGVPVFEYEPRLVKKAIVGWGGADKSQVIRMIAARLGLPEAPAEDAADAMAIALCHLQRLGGAQAANPSQPL